MKRIFWIIALFVGLSVNGQTRVINAKIKAKQVDEVTAADSIVVRGSDEILKYISRSNLLSAPFTVSGTVTANSFVGGGFSASGSSADAFELRGTNNYKMYLSGSQFVLRDFTNASNIFIADIFTFSLYGNLNMNNHAINNATTITANSFIKSGATSNDILLGDGTTTSLSGLMPLSGNTSNSVVSSVVNVFDLHNTITYATTGSTNKPNDNNGFVISTFLDGGLGYAMQLGGRNGYLGVNFKENGVDTGWKQIATQEWALATFSELTGDNVAFTNVDNNFSVGQTINGKTYINHGATSGAIDFTSTTRYSGLSFTDNLGTGIFQWDGTTDKFILTKSLAVTGTLDVSDAITVTSNDVIDIFKKQITFTTGGWARNVFEFENIGAGVTEPKLEFGVRGEGIDYQYSYWGFGDFDTANNVRVYDNGTFQANVLNVLATATFGGLVTANGELLVNAYNTAGVEKGIYFRSGFTDPLTNGYNASILVYDHGGGGTTTTDGLTISGYDGVSFSTGSNTRNEVARFSQAGNFGIGTVTPTEKLDVNGNIKASGTLDVSGTATFNGAVTANGVVNIDNSLDAKLILYKTSGTEWNYMQFVGTDDIRDGYFGVSSNNDLVWHRNNGSGINLRANGTNNINGSTTIQGDISVTGAGTFSGLITANANLKLPDNSYFQIGNDSDFQIYHNGSDTYLHDNGTGAVIHRVGVDDIAYWRTEGLQFYDNKSVRIGSSADLMLFHSGVESYIDNETGDLYFRQYADNSQIWFQNDNGLGGITTYFQIDGLGEANVFHKRTRHLDAIGAYFGNSNDLGISHNGTNSFIDNNTGDFYIRTLADNKAIRLRADDGSGGLADYVWIDGNIGSVSLFHYGSKKLETTSTGVTVTGQTFLDGTNDLTLKPDFGANDSQILASKGLELTAGAGYGVKLVSDPGVVFEINSTGTSNVKYDLQVDQDLNVDGKITGAVANIPLGATETGTGLTVNDAMAGTIIPFTNSNNITVTINTTSLQNVGDLMYLDQNGTATLTVSAGTGVTLQVLEGYQATCSKQYGRLIVQKVAAATYKVYGDIDLAM